MMDSSQVSARRAHKAIFHTMARGWAARVEKLVESLD